MQIQRDLNTLLRAIMLRNFTTQAERQNVLAAWERISDIANEYAMNELKFSPPACGGVPSVQGCDNPEPAHRVHKRHEQATELR